MSVHVCPICRCDWPALPTRCVCGYDFQTGSAREAMRSLAIEQRAANRRVFGALALLGSSAVTIALAQLLAPLLVAMPLLLAVQILGGLGLLGSGLARGMRAGKQLARAREAHQLPEARLLR